MIGRRFITLALGFMLVCALVACGGGAPADLAATQPAATAAAPTEPSPALVAAPTEPVDEPITDPAADLAETTISLSDAGITIDGVGAAAAGSTVTITADGFYRLSGALTDGQLIVDAPDAYVVLALAGVSLGNSTTAPVYIREAEAVEVILEPGSENTFSDAAAYVYPDPEADEPNAAFFSDVDMTIRGEGLLRVTGNYNDGLASKDGLIIEAGTFDITAVDDAIRGKDYVIIYDGEFTVNAGGDGLKSDEEDDPELGYIYIEQGGFSVMAGGDAITAERDVFIVGGRYTLTTAGGSATPISDDLSAKGIKAGQDVFIDQGTFDIDAADDAIHANGSISIATGDFTLASGDDAIHADSTIVIDDGTYRITTSYEGIEGAVITISAGTIDIVSSDDGINIAGGVDASGEGPGAGPGPRPPGGPAQFGQTYDYTGSDFLYLNGGQITIDAAGDGIDVNGAIVMTGGTVVVHGPTESMNGAIDYDGGFRIEGGTLVAAGSAGMVQAPDGSSLQNSVVIFFGSAVAPGTEIVISDGSGGQVVRHTPAKAAESLVFSSPDLLSGETYEIAVGGVAFDRFTVAGVVTQVGQGGGFGRPPRP